MGNCRSRAALRRQDRELDKTSTFVRYAMLGDLPSLQLMLAKGKMDPNAQDRFGMTALHWAAYTGKLACIQELLRAGASTKIVDQNGRNALHHACRKDQDDVVRFLIQSEKMDVNSVSENKDTPLHKAVRGKGIKSIEVLLQHGADPHLCNDQNRTPLEELASNPGTAMDTAQTEISTARVNEQLEALRHDFQGDSGFVAKPKSRTNSFSVAGFSSRFYGGIGSGAVGVADHTTDSTLITKFGASIREFSEQRSSDHSLSSRTSSAHGLGMWAKVTGNSATAATVSSSSAKSSASTPMDISLLDLASLNAKLNTTLSCTASASPSCSTSVTPHSVAATIRHQSSNNEALAPSGGGALMNRRSLKYSGKRVIMLLRVKHHMPVDEKQEMIRLLLRKHMQRGSSNVNLGVSGHEKGQLGDPEVVAKCTKAGDGSSDGTVEGKTGDLMVTTKSLPPIPLQHKISGLTLSLPPDN